MSLRFTSTLFLLSLSGTVVAGPAADAAKLHFKAIAAGDVEQLMRGYSEEANLQWIGGPLDGVYAGGEKLRALWGKFAQSQGPLGHAVNNIQENANPKGTTVTANVEFQGKSTIKVRYVLTYRDSKIVNEIWQIDPNMGQSYATGY